VNKIKLHNMLDDVLFSILVTVALMGVIEGDNPFIQFAGFTLVVLLSGIVLAFIFSILISRRKSLKIQELIYRGKLPTLIEELRLSGLYFHKQIGDVYIFCTKRFLSRNIRLLVIKEQKHWCISCDEYSLKNFYNSSYINLSVEKKSI
jgi:hypothetical protein